ncbi:MAG TPA: alpha/beta hydrolase [Pyrinomonadaceae bacterium]|jgi:pimeloyl-ACP methyl ester carboxylesterase
MTFIETKDGTKLFYKDWGNGSKPVVLVHGWCINCDSWEYVMNDLPNRGLRCIAYDQRGCGRSAQSWNGYDYNTLADDLAAVLEHLDLREATLVGHSMGSGVVTRYLTKYGGKRVSEIVFVSGTTPFLLKTPDNPQGIDASFFEESLAAIKKDRAGYVGKIALPFFGIEKPDEKISQEMIDWGVALTLQASPRAATEMLRACFESDQREEVKKITVPTLIIHSDQDDSSPLEITAKRTHELLPNSQLKIYENSSHGLYITESQRLCDDIAAFIQK